MRSLHLSICRVLTVFLCVAPMATAGASLAPAEAKAVKAPPPAGGASYAALDYAFRFASGIESDAKDRAKAQELALGEYAAAGAFDEVARRADEVDGWRRGVVYADLAAHLARAGRTEEARAYVRRAEEVQQGVSGWEGPRISAYIAEALALLGETEKSNTLSASLANADPIQYTGRAAATAAVGDAMAGNFAAAMQRLRALDANDDLDAAWSRTVGYLALARQPDLPKASRLEAIEAARASAQRLLPERRLDALLQIAPEMQALGRKADAKETVATAARALEEQGTGTPGAIAGLIAIGAGWADVSEPGRGRKALQRAEGLVPQALSVDQPGLIARIASAYRRLPDPERARQLDLKAIDSAAAMRLARPRALALAAICRQMGRDGVALDEVLGSRLEGLLAGLGDPW